MTYSANTNKIEARWESIAGADGYELYINTVDNSGSAELFSTITSPIITSADIETYSRTSAAITRSTTYYVWVKAYNAAGATDFSPAAKVRTSETVPTWWFINDEQGNVVRWNSDSEDYNVTQTSVSYNFDVYPQAYAYKGTIRHHIIFNKSESASVQPYTQVGKWKENLSDGESGVFIIEYDSSGIPGYVRDRPELGNFIGIYYWGAGSTLVPDRAFENNPFVAPHLDMKLVYLSNSCLITWESTSIV